MDYRCTNPDCTEHDLPKDAPHHYDDPVVCGECGHECQEHP